MEQVEAIWATTNVGGKRDTCRGGEKCKTCKYIVLEFSTCRWMYAYIYILYRYYFVFLFNTSKLAKVKQSCTLYLCHAHVCKLIAANTYVTWHYIYIEFQKCACRFIIWKHRLHKLAFFKNIPKMSKLSYAHVCVCNLKICIYISVLYVCKCICK